MIESENHACKFDVFLVSNFKFWNEITYRFKFSIKKYQMKKLKQRKFINF